MDAPNPVLGRRGMLELPLETPANARAFVRELVAELGGGFHPDTPMAEYLNLETGALVYTPAEAATLERRLERAFELIDVYAFAAPLVAACVRDPAELELERWNDRADELEACSDEELELRAADRSRPAEYREHAAAVLTFRRNHPEDLEA